MLDSGSQPTLTSLGQGCKCMFRCNLSPVLLAEWLGSFMCHCGNTGVERTPNKSWHTKLTLEKKILPPLLLGFELATFQSQVQHSNQQAIPAPPLSHTYIHTYHYGASATGSYTNIGKINIVFHLHVWALCPGKFIRTCTGTRTSSNNSIISTHVQDHALTWSWLLVNLTILPPSPVLMSPVPLDLKPETIQSTLNWVMHKLQS